MRRARDLDRLQALVAADAVIDVDDEIARGQLGGLGDEVFRLDPPLSRPGEAFAEDVLLGHHREARRDEAALECNHGGGDRTRRTVGHLVSARHRSERADAVLAHHRGQAIARAFAERRHQHAPALGEDRGDMRFQRLVNIGPGPDPDGGEIVARAGARVRDLDHAGGQSPRILMFAGFAGGRDVGRGEGRKLGPSARREDSFPFGAIEVRARGRHRIVGRGILAAFAAHGRAGLEVFPD